MRDLDRSRLKMAAAAFVHGVFLTVAFTTLLWSTSLLHAMASRTKDASDVSASVVLAMPLIIIGTVSAWFALLRARVFVLSVCPVCGAQNTKKRALQNTYSGTDYGDGRTVRAYGSDVDGYSCSKCGAF